jgi:hypothetical protein
MSAIQNFIEWFKRKTCPHLWQPALTSRGPARHCQICDTTLDLSEPEFYARFGRMPYL